LQLSAFKRKNGRQTQDGAVGRLMRMRYSHTQKGSYKSSVQATEMRTYTQCHNREDSNICATDSKESTSV
jgi:predicted transcriptional regulator